MKELPRKERTRAARIDIKTYRGRFRGRDDGRGTTRRGEKGWKDQGTDNLGKACAVFVAEGRGPV